MADVYDGPLPPGKSSKSSSAASKLPRPQMLKVPKVPNMPSMPNMPKIPKTLRRSAPVAPSDITPPQLARELSQVSPEGKQQALQTFVPRLNRYIQGRLDRIPGEITSYVAAVSALNTRVNGRVMSTVALQRLALYGALPPSLVPQLLPMLSSEDRRVVRLAYYLIQIQLGCGAAGTPTLPPTRGGELIVFSPVPVEIMANAWRDIANEDATTESLQMSLRSLVAAKRAYPALLKKDLTTGIEIVLDRASEVDPMKANDSKAQENVAALRHCALVAARAGVTDAKPADKIARRVLRQILSRDPQTARHALALSVDVARKDPRGIAEGLGPFVADAVALYDAAGLKATATPKKGAEDTINLQDKWARVYLARLCSAVVHSGSSSSQDADTKGFFQMLALLATRDDSTMVGLEAVRSLAGRFPQRQAGLGIDGAALEVSQQDARCRSRAWQVLLAQADSDARGSAFASGQASTLIGVVGERVCGGLQAPYPAIVCSAARAAGALGEARMRSGVRSRKRSPETADVMAEIAEELHHVAEGSATPPIRSAALEALFWFQEVGQPPRITPLSLLRNVTSSGQGTSAWPRDLLEAVMSAITCAERSSPGSSGALMACAGALAAASPSGVNLSRVVSMWTSSVKAGRAGKEAALHAALGILSSPSPPSATAPTGAPIEVLAQSAAEDAAWLSFQRMSAWWLGENANVAAGEYAGTSGVDNGGGSQEEGSLRPPSGRVDINTHGKQLSAGEVIALQAAENPAMMAVVAQLQHAVLAMPWEVRIAAAQAIAKVAVRSEEPYRIHCYSILRSLAAHDATNGHDPLGVAAVVVPAVQLLDRIYATRVTLEGLARRHGDRPLEWPVHVVEQLTQRNAQLVAQIQDQIGAMPSGLFHPLGPIGKELLQAAATEGLEAFKGGLDQQHAEEAAHLADLQRKAEQNEQQKAEKSGGITMEAVPTSQQQLGSDGRPTWMQRLEASPENTGFTASSDSDDAEEISQPASTFVSPSGGTDPLADMMAQLDQKMAPPVRKREAWEQLPTPSQVPNAGNWSLPSPPSPAHTLTAQHSRQLSWAEATPKVQRDGKARLLYDFQGADEAELTVFAGQTVTLMYETDAWMMVATDSGRSGLVPSSFLDVADTRSPFDSQPSARDPFSSSSPAADSYSGYGSDPFAETSPKYQDDPFAQPAASYDDPFADGKATIKSQGRRDTEDNSDSEVHREPSFSVGYVPHHHPQPQQPTSTGSPLAGGARVSSGMAAARTASSPIREGSRVSHVPRPSLLNIDDEFISAGNEAADREGEQPQVPQEPRRLRRGRIKAKFEAEGDDEVTVALGDLIEADGEEVDGWLDIVRLNDGIEGIVPSWVVDFDT